MRMLVVVKRDSMLNSDLVKMISNIDIVDILIGSAGPSLLDFISGDKINILIAEYHKSDSEGILEFLSLVRDHCPSLYHVLVLNKNDFDKLPENIHDYVEDFLTTDSHPSEIILRIKSMIKKQNSLSASTNVFANRPSVQKLESSTVEMDVSDTIKMQSNHMKNANIHSAIPSDHVAEAGSSEPLLIKKIDQEHEANDMSVSLSGSDKHGFLPWDRKPAIERKRQREVKHKDTTITPNHERPSKMGKRFCKQSGWHKALKIAGHVLFSMLLIVTLLLGYVLVKSQVTDSPPSIFGYELYNVLSGSMNPTFDAGSIVIVRQTDPISISKGDIITFSGSGKAITTHRVVDINQNGGLQFVTRGDANNVNDPVLVTASHVRGKVIASISYAGFALAFIRSREGLLILIFIPIILILIFRLIKHLVHARRI